MIQSIVNCQIAYARALIVDRQALAEAQDAGDIVRAEEILLDAFRTDMRPLLAAVREEMGVAMDPLAAYRKSGYLEKVAAERGAAGGGSGYPGA